MQEPPDLVEIFTPWSRKIDPGRKFDVYASSDVPEYWLVDPEPRRFQIFVLWERLYEEIPMVDGHLQSDVIPGLVVEPAALFAELDQE